MLKITSLRVFLLKMVILQFYSTFMIPKDFEIFEFAFEKEIFYHFSVFSKLGSKIASKHFQDKF
jgi:hypothetical protein